MHLKPISRELRRELYGRHSRPHQGGGLGPVIGGGVGPGHQGSRDGFSTFGGRGGGGGGGGFGDRRRSRSRSRGRDK